MRTGQGGTNMWCPACRKVRPCKAVPAAEITGNPRHYQQRFYQEGHEDLNWFQRGRICLDCEAEFVTAEVDRDFLYELVDLREALAQVKAATERYVERSTATAAALEDLTNALSDLRALKAYNDEPSPEE